jgi:hypothetical protein
MKKIILILAMITVYAGSSFAFQQQYIATGGLNARYTITAPLGSNIKYVIAYVEANTSNSSQADAQSTVTAYWCCGSGSATKDTGFLNGASKSASASGYMYAPGTSCLSYISVYVWGYLGGAGALVQY